MRAKTGIARLAILTQVPVIPQKLIDAGFTWDYPHVTSALDALIEN